MSPRGGDVLDASAHDIDQEAAPLTSADSVADADADALLADVFRGVSHDPLDLLAGIRDGFRSLAVGIAANASLASGDAQLVAALGLPLR